MRHDAARGGAGFYPNDPHNCYTAQGADCEKCRFIATIKRKTFCGWVPPRCSLHQIIKSAYAEGDDDLRRCIYCTHYHLSLSCNTCADCLVTPNLINYKADWCAEELRAKREKGCSP